MPAWTPVTERLPTVGQTVLAYGRNEPDGRWRALPDRIEYVHAGSPYWGLFDTVSHWIAFEDVEGPT